MENLLKEALEALQNAGNKTQLQEIYNLYLSKEGESGLFDGADERSHR